MINGTIYKITCLVNGKCYIGQTFQPVKKRWAEHKKGNGSKAIYHAIQKYGLEMFKFEILHEGITCRHILNELEILLISSHNSFRNGYNQHSGGQDEYRLSKLWKHADEICHLYTIEEKSLAQIARQFDTSKVMIMTILEANQIKRRDKSPAWEYSEEICRLYTEELISCVEIASMIEVSEGTILRILKKHNIKTRKVGKLLDNLWEYQNEICRLYTVEMKSTGEIAEIYNTNRMRIHRILKANNIKAKYRRRRQKTKDCQLTLNFE